MFDVKMFVCATLLAAALQVPGYSVSRAATHTDSAAQPAWQWQAGKTISQQTVRKWGIDRFFKAMPVPGQIQKLMEGKSFPNDCTVKWSELRYLQIVHYNGEGAIQLGEMVCNKAIAGDLLQIFRQLYNAHYPIERMLLIDRYGASDENSMSHNNSSCFCFRKIKGQKHLSKHALGLAVDINPLYNPCIRHIKGRLTIQPANGKCYTDRKKVNRYTITRTSLIYKLFTRYGFKWGGAWKSLKDYQHFER